MELSKRSAALARLAEVVAELTGWRGLDDRNGGDFCGGGATIFAESDWPFFEIGSEGGLYRRLCKELGTAFSLACACCLRVGDFESFLLPVGLDIAEADLKCGAEGAESADCLRMLVGILELFGESFESTLREPECGGVGYARFGVSCMLRSGMLGAG